MGICNSKDEETSLPTADECVTDVLGSMKRKRVHVAVFVCDDVRREAFAEIVDGRLKSAELEANSFDTEKGISEYRFTGTGSRLRIIVARTDMKCEEADFRNTWIQDEYYKMAGHEQISRDHFIPVIALVDSVKNFRMRL